MKVVAPAGTASFQEKVLNMLSCCMLASRKELPETATSSLVSAAYFGSQYISQGWATGSQCVNLTSPS